MRPFCPSAFRLRLFRSTSAVFLQFSSLLTSVSSPTPYTTRFSSRPGTNTTFFGAAVTNFATAGSAIARASTSS